MRKYGLGARNDEGEMAVQFAIRFGMAFLNTYFQKKRENQATYKSGAISPKLTTYYVQGTSCEK